MKRIIKIIVLPVIGFVIALTGFVYDVMFAGIPYQDPTPELQAGYNFHSSVAGMLYKTGGIVLLIGLLAIPFIWRNIMRNEYLQSPADDSLKAPPEE